MASPSLKGWHELQRVAQPDCPKVFYNFTFGKDSLRLLFTDLVGIWECLMKKPTILTTAQAQRTSIDPSESNSQLQILLQKLEEGLESNDNAVLRDSTSENIYLRSRVQLPRPLNSFSWTFELVPQDAVELAEELLRPCLFEASLSKQKLNDLHQVIKDKDHVISRLMERFEASNTDLSLVFPGVKSRRGRVTVAEAEKIVPGMAAFDAATWSLRFDDRHPYASYESKGFDRLVSGCQKCPKHTARQHSDWLKHLPTTEDWRDERLSPTPATNETKKESKVDADDESTASEDEFERQATPPHLRNSGAHQTSATNTKRSTSPPGHKDNMSKKRKYSSSPPSGRGEHSRNGHMQTERQSKSGAVPTTTHNAIESNSSDSETASEDDDLDAQPDNHRATQRDSNANNSNIETTDRQQQASDTTSDEESQSASKKTAAKPVKKLGMIKKSLPQRSRSGSSSTSSPPPSSPAVATATLKSKHVKQTEPKPADSSSSSDEATTKATQKSNRKTTGPIRKLGRIGGNKNTKHPPLPQNQDQDEDDDNDKDKETKEEKDKQKKEENESHRLRGQNSIKREESTDPSFPTSPPPPSLPSTDPTTTTTKTTTKMTAEEKANHRREELKRRFDRGPKNGPNSDLQPGSSLASSNPNPKPNSSFNSSSTTTTNATGNATAATAVTAAATVREGSGVRKKRKF